MIGPRAKKAFAAAVLALSGTGAHGVRLDPEAGGQALIYPYYTVRSFGTDPYNTYISVVNTTSDGKALRVRFREATAGLESLGFNLFLSPNDTWTGALVPSVDGGTLLVSADESCTKPALPVQGAMRAAPLTNAAFAADPLDRTREGYVEILEMATVTGATLAAISQGGSNGARNCGVVQNAAVNAGDLAAPNGGLQGTLTLINVQSGMDFTVNAEALADLASGAYYREPADAYPDFDAKEIAPVSEIATQQAYYRLAWQNPVDAVSSVLMTPGLGNEYVLDTGTASSSDWTLAFPTRRFYVSGTSATGPFAPEHGDAPGCIVFSQTVFDREARKACDTGPCSGVEFPEPPPSAPAPRTCAAAGAVSWQRVSPVSTPLFGSKAGIPSNRPNLGVPSEFQNGWAVMAFTGAGSMEGLVSASTSTRRDARTGVVTPGAERVFGVPVVGFFGRDFLNGTLTCSSGSCQGSYGSAFRHSAPPIVDTP